MRIRIRLVTLDHPTCHFDADSDPSFHFEADPDPSFHFDADPDQSFHFDTDPDPTVTLMRIRIRLSLLCGSGSDCHFDADPDR